ncbi:pancreatic secretory granule membrane major glycoprotein GP2-like isoform X2 [Conger conger]|uniref:pancreatic secretory granule membrane major glycoprotein GP2-like isoform X2 n=1 Tax=Conger conger TaxID=82655 RepID=UPI002A59C999|nr:pancreatic secretory granule membrane major glycoprotein GP2-like isoform X2 [Conger conger]
MGLYSDASSHAYAGPVELPLFARLHIQDSLAFKMSLQLEACWATETTDPQEERRAFYLKEGCPSNRTFRWHLQDGWPQRRRFSVQMFTVSDHAHVYLHCLTRICSPDEDCTTGLLP